MPRGFSKNFEIGESSEILRERLNTKDLFGSKNRDNATVLSSNKYIKFVEIVNFNRFKYIF